MEVETRPQPGEGTAAGLVIALALAHFLLQPARKQGAYGGAFLGSENASLLEEIGFNFQSDIRFCAFHVCTYFRVARFYVPCLEDSTLSCRMQFSSQCRCGCVLAAVYGGRKLQDLVIDFGRGFV
jgi:hypothetical protein